MSIHTHFFLNHYHSFPCSHLWFQPRSPACSATLTASFFFFFLFRVNNQIGQSGKKSRRAKTQTCSIRALVDRIWQKSPCVPLFLRTFSVTLRANCVISQVVIRPSNKLLRTLKENKLK